jgi:hypothetical protein
MDKDVRRYIKSLIYILMWKKKLITGLPLKIDNKKLYNL